tara:strand:+ start:36295 stop:37494 length:1200 start_codon:yes stop_codon:yes gene_type:complete
MSHFGVTGKVSTINSSTQPLGADGVYTGTGEDVSTFATITVFADTDQDGSLAMQFSSDNVNWDRQKIIAVDQSISTGSVHTLEVVAQYFRVIYTNEATSQAHLRIQTIYHNGRSGFLTSSPDEVISKINDAQIVRVSNDPFLDVSRSLYADKSAIHKFGSNHLTGTTERDIWSYGATDRGNINYNWLQAPTALRIAAGGDAADTFAGAGARTVRVEGLDENWVFTSEDIATSGIGVSASTTTQFARCNRAYVVDVGAYTASNVGDIVIENSAGGTVVASIETGFGQTEMSMYTIPSGFTGYLRYTQATVSAAANKEATVTLFSRRNANDTSAPFSNAAKRIIHKWPDLNTTASLDVFALPSLPEMTDIWGTTEANATSNVNLTYDLILVKGDTPTDPQS